MTTLSDPPSESFQLSKLVNDTRYRSYTFQFIALLCVIFLMSYLGWNLTQNLAEQGLTLSFKFLGDPAGYDINQRLIEYNNQMSHWRAALVGAANTLLVSFLGCITATVIGVVVGVLRLSKNWLVAKIMAVYVEIFRNVPVLIWILIINTFVTLMPSPRAYRGDSPDVDMFLGIVAYTNRGIYVPAPVWGAGSAVVVAVFLLSIAGIIFFRRWATKQLFDHGRMINTLWPTLGLFFVPALLAFFVMGMPIGVDIPSISGFNFEGGTTIARPLISLWLALSIYTAAFIAENVRAGIISVSRGQTEAAAALGMRPNRIMNLVVLPQALRVIIPPMISNYLNLTKNSSLAIAVSYMDLTGTLGGITLNQTGRAIECVLLLMLFYLTISLSISAIMNVYNNAIKLKER